MPRAKKQKKETAEDLEIESISSSSEDETTITKKKKEKKPKKDKRTKKSKKKDNDEETEEDSEYEEEKPQKKKKITKKVPKRETKKAKKRKREEESEEEESEEDEKTQKPKKKKAKKESTESKAHVSMPEAQTIKTESLEKQNFVFLCGAHVSGGAQAKKAVEDCVAIRDGTEDSSFFDFYLKFLKPELIFFIFFPKKLDKKFVGKCMALFIDTPRQWTFEKNKTLSQKDIDEFNKLCKDHEIDKEKNVVPHGSYLINLCAPNTATFEKSKKQLAHEMERCLQFGIKVFSQILQISAN